MFLPAYHVDAAGRIIPISFRSDRDSCIHVFDDESETYNSQWSSSSNSNSAVHQENHDDPKREKEEDCPISTHDKDEDSHKGVDNGTTCPPAHITHVISDASSDSKNTDEAPYYGGVYYGEKDDNGETPLKQSQLFQDVMVDTEIPVYGGVYYGSDEEPPKEAAMPDANLNVDVDVDVDPPSVDYFAGIRICRNPSTSSVSTLSKEHTHDVGEECSFDSFRSKESSLMSAEEREWQRRLREDLLHPVTEDAAIVDATIVNLSGFTKEGDGRKRNRRRNKG